MNQEKRIHQFQKNRRWLTVAGLIFIFLLMQGALWGFYYFQVNLWEESLSQNLRSAGVLTSQRLSGFPEALWLGSDTFDPIFFQSLAGPVRDAGLIEEAFLINPQGGWIAGLIGEVSPSLVDPILGLDKESILTAAAGITAVAEPYRAKGFYFQNAYSPIFSDSGSLVGVLGVRARMSSIEWFQKGLMILLFLSGSSLLVFILIGLTFWRVSGQMAKVLETMAETEQLASLGRMSAAVAHEIRNPLGIMVQTNSLLRKRYDKDEKDEIFDYIPEEVKRLNFLTQEFLDFAKGKSSNPERIDFSELVLTSLKRVQFDFSNIEIKLNIEDGIFLNADKGQLTSVILNLLFNSRDALPEGGLIEVTLSRENGVVTFAIKDNGTGMEIDVIETAFNQRKNFKIFH